MIRTEIDSVPEEVDQKQRQLMRLQIEFEALKREKDEKTAQRTASIKKQILDLKNEVEVLNSQYTKEKDHIKSAQSIRKEIEATQLEISQAERSYDLERAAQLRHGKLPQLEQKLEETKGQDSEEHELLREEVTESEVCQVISRWTGIPVEKLTQGE